MLFFLYLYCFCHQNVLYYLFYKKFAVKKISLEEFQNEINEDLKKSFLKFIAGSKVSTQYKSDVKQYLFDFFEELGFVDSSTQLEGFSTDEINDFDFNALLGNDDQDVIDVTPRKGKE